jgi:hypothetical protein
VHFGTVPKGETVVAYRVITVSHSNNDQLVEKAGNVASSSAWVTCFFCTCFGYVHSFRRCAHKEKGCLKTIRLSTLLAKGMDDSEQTYNML